MARGASTLSLALPPFTKAVKYLVIANVGIFAAMLLMKGLAPGLYSYITFATALVPAAVVHGWVWQLVSYSFFHSGVGHVLFNMLALWMFGAQFEMEWGTRKFLEYYFWCVIGAALTTIAVGYIGIALAAASPATPLFNVLASIAGTATIGASGGVYGLLIAFGLIYGNREIMIFPFPFLIKAKYMVTVWILLAVFGALGGQGGVAYFAHLGGALFGWFYLRYMPRHGLQFAMSESYYGVRNRYYRWKRRQAAKKFEVYMNKHRREDFFDEYGNFRGPQKDDEKSEGEGRGPWVN